MEELFRKERERTLRLCMRILGSRADAEEAMQEAFLRVAQHIGEVRTNPAAYLAMVARRTCWEMLRAADPRTLPIETVEVEGGLDPADMAQRRDVLARTWRRLSRTDRRLILDSFAGYSYQEMAERTGLSPKAVSVELHRARARARAFADNLASLLPWLRGRLPRPSAVVGWLRTRPAEWSRLAEAPLLLSAILAIAALGLGAQPPTAHPGSPPPPPAVPATLAARPAAAPARPGWLPPSAAAEPGSGSIGQREAARPSGIKSGASSPLPLISASWRRLDDVEASPHYARDHTLLALAVQEPCITACYELAGSTDGGHAWKRWSTPVGIEPTRGEVWSAVQLLLPPSFPERIYAVAQGQTRVGPMLSEDGGATFVSLPAGGPYASLAPGWPADIVTSGRGLVGYAGLVPRPGPVFPLGLSAGGPPAVVPGIVGAEVLQPVIPDDAAGEASRLLRCAASCILADTLPAGAGDFRLVPSPTYAGDGTIVAWPGREYGRPELWVSTDRAATFRSHLTPDGLGIDDLALIRLDGGLRLVAWLAPVDFSPPGLDSAWYSDDLGATWRQGELSSAFPAWSIGWLVAPSRDRLIAGLTPTDGPTYWACSLDQGVTWDVCPPLTPEELSAPAS